MIAIENFPRGIGEHELRRLFEDFGAVATVLFHDTLERVLVRMKDREAALDAVVHLNGRDLGGSRLVVRQVRR